MKPTDSENSLVSEMQLQALRNSELMAHYTATNSVEIKSALLLKSSVGCVALEWMSEENRCQLFSRTTQKIWIRAHVLWNFKSGVFLSFMKLREILYS